ncbi:DUF6968 family protein [Peristeroidobacter soli]|jgi:hypothetical protein|uniref:DUF6968 family protein n=1 Tax=Peristeroidobacter soli TaxID=2497877 RepID=UPI00101CAA08|nr:hypothetical protein [Peristeroidobacter soli]
MLNRTFSYIDMNNDCHNVVAIIDAPKKLELPLNAPPGQPGAYACDFRVNGADLDIKGSAFGVDEFHAVLGAFRDLRLQLDALGDRIKFLDIAGWTGIPRMVTLGDSIEVQRRIEAVLDNEHKKRQDELTARRLAAESKEKR